MTLKLLLIHLPLIWVEKVREKSITHQTQKKVSVASYIQNKALWVQHVYLSNVLMTVIVERIWLKC